MTGAVVLLALASGLSGEGAVLHTCRLGAAGGEAYGEAAIIESFRRDPMAFASTRESVEAAGHLAVFGDDCALFADVSAAGIARLWRLGPGTPAWPEPRIDVPFDPCLAQDAILVAFAGSDHAALAPDATARVVAVGRDIIRDSGPSDVAARLCAFVIRAFGDADRGAALFSVHRLGGDRVRTAGFAHVAAFWRGGTVHIVHDRAGEAAVAASVWSPVIAPGVAPAPNNEEPPI